MLRQHLPQILSHVTTFSRYALGYFHATGRAMFGTLLHLESPRDAFRIALRQRQIGRFPKRPGSHKPAVLLHYHIFKNAGTSFERALELAFRDKYQPYDSPHPGGIVTQRELARLLKEKPHLRAISTHQASPPAPRLPGRKVLTSILIRDPIARIRSIYAFERAQKVQTPGARKAKELDFKGYVEWRLETSPVLFCNFQVWFCSGRNSTSPPTESDLEVAIIRLDAMDVVGTVGRYKEWLALAESILSQHFGQLSLAVAHENRSTVQSSSESDVFGHLIEELGSAMADELLQKNEMDMRLHQIADSLLTRKLAEADVAVNLGKTYARVRNEIGVSRNSLRK